MNRMTKQKLYRVEQTVATGWIIIARGRRKSMFHNLNLTVD